MHNSLESTDCIQRLRTLPAETLPPYNWQEFQRRARGGTAPARLAMDWRPLAAAAALLLFVCAIAVWGRFGGGGRHVVVASGAVENGATAGAHGSDSATAADGESLVQADSATADHGLQSGEAAADQSWRTSANGAAARSNDRDLVQGGAVGPKTTVAGQTSSELAVANKRSRAIESWLAALPREPAVVRVGTRAAVAGLEDRIAQVDDLMTSMRIEGMSGDRLADMQRERLRLVGSLAQVRYAEVVASASP